MVRRACAPADSRESIDVSRLLEHDQFWIDRWVLHPSLDPLHRGSPKQPHIIDAGGKDRVPAADSFPRHIDSLGFADLHVQPRLHRGDKIVEGEGASGGAEAEQALRAEAQGMGGGCST
jgi:hypothetical protein